MIETTFVLPVGKVWNPNAFCGPVHGRHKGGTRRQAALHDPARGFWNGPFFVVREVPRLEFAGWLSEQHGEPVRVRARSRQWFYQIALD